MPGHKTYIIYFRWANTANNHSGMAYLVEELKRRSPGSIKLIEMPKNIDSWNVKLKRIHFYLLCFWLRLFLNRSDKVFFMEYLGTCSGNQTGLAINLRKWGMEQKFIGLVHLPGSYLMELYDNIEDIKKGAEALDNIVVFGSSLARFFSNLGYQNKLIKTFHYVDTGFYKPGTEQKPHKLQVIHIGSLKRNFDLLREIVEVCHAIDFHICQGLRDLSGSFKNLNNVKLYGFLPEQQLLKLMQSCDISLSILDDTEGSNVITTSMACGLVNLVSDVGSIRDYCTDENSVLCKNKTEFVEAIRKLDSDRSTLNKLSSASLKHSQNLTLDKSVQFFLNEL